MLSAESKIENKRQVDCSFCRHALCNFKFQSSPRFLCRKRSARCFPLGQANCRAEADEANMEEKTQVFDHVQLPFLTNPKLLKAGEQLVVLKPTEDQGNAEGAPKKSQKVDCLGFCSAAFFLSMVTVTSVKNGKA